MSNNTTEYNDINPMFSGSYESEYQDKIISSSDKIVIYPPTLDWDFMKQRPQQLMEQFSRNGYDVFYCNKTQTKTELFTAINPSLRIVHNNFKFIKEIVPKLKSMHKKILLWVSWSKLHLFLDQYQADFIVYDYLDDFSAWEPYLKPMIDKANIVITTSQILKEQMSKEFSYKQCFLVPNGCDTDHFSMKKHSEKPLEFKNHTGRIITYSGAWARWVDHVLVNSIANTFSDTLVAIIGVEFGSSVEKSISNLKYLGYKSYNDLPSYLQYSNVCIIPFLLNQITLATNPIKMYEYLASGTPVISTNIPEARNKPSVYIGESHADFIEKIRMVLDNKIGFNGSEVYPWLEMHTWASRYAVISNILHEYGF